MVILLRVMNYIAFYGLWVLCLLAAVAREPLWAVPAVVLYLTVHLLFFSTFPVKEGILIALMTVLGGINESVLASLGVVTYTGAYWKGIAWWTLCLWACFGSTYWHAFSWLEGRPMLSAVLGAIVAPICYLSVERAGGVVFSDGRVSALVAIGALWAVVLPCTFALSRRLRCGRWT
jgi:hypothetical protein